MNEMGSVSQLFGSKSSLDSQGAPIKQSTIYAVEHDDFWTVQIDDQNIIYTGLLHRIEALRYAYRLAKMIDCDLIIVREKQSRASKISKLRNSKIGSLALV